MSRRVKGLLLATRGTSKTAEFDGNLKELHPGDLSLPASAMADLLDMSARHLRRLVEDGVLPKDGGRHDIYESVKTYVQRLKSGDERSERSRRRDEIKLEQEEINLRRAQRDEMLADGELALLSEIESEMIRAFGVVRDEILALPDVLEDEANLTPEQVELATAYTYRVIESLFSRLAK